MIDDYDLIDWHGDEPCHLHRMAKVVLYCLSACVVMALGAALWWAGVI